MKEKTRKLLGVFLALAFCVGVLPVGVRAATATTVSFQVKTSNGASGTVSYKFNDSQDSFTSVTPDTDGSATVNVPSGATTITVKAEPTDESKVNKQHSGIWVNGNNTLTGETKSAFFNALTGQNGYTYTLTEGTPQFQIEFDNNDGTGGGGGEQQQGNASTTFSFNANTNENGISSISYKVNNAEEWTTENGSHANFNGVDLQTGNTLTLKLTLAAGYSIDTDSISVKYEKDGQSSAEAVVNKSDVAEGLQRESGYTFEYSPLSEFSGGQLRVQLNLTKTFSQSVTLHFYVQSKTAEGDTYGAVTAMSDVQHIAEDFTFNGNAVTTTNGAATMGGYPNGAENNVLTLREAYGAKIDKVLVKSGAGSDFSSDTAEIVATRGLYTANLAPAEHYSILIQEGVSDDVTILWSYLDSDKDTDLYVENGKAYVDKIVRGQSEIPLDGAHPWYTSEGGYVQLKRGDVVTMRFVPDYGYQLKNASLNGYTMEPQEAVSTFTVTMTTNFHLAGAFVSAENEINTSSEKVSSASIANGSNAAGNGGILSMSVADTDTDSAVTSSYGTAVSSLNITLKNLVSKGTGTEGATDYWESNVTTFDNPISVSVTLDSATQSSLPSGQTFSVVRNHDSTLTDLNATYSNGTLTFDTNQFSTYTIVRKAIPVSYTADDYDPPASNTDTANTAQETAETAADDGSTTVEVTATVSSDGTATVSAVSEDAIAAIAASGEEQQNVVFDLSGLGDDVTAVSLPADAFGAVADALSEREGTSDSVTIATGTGEVRFDENAVAAIADAIGSDAAADATVELRVESTGVETLNEAQQEALEALGESTELLAKYELNLSVGGEPVTDFKGGSVTIGLPFTMKAGAGARNYGVYYAAADGKLERRPTGFAGGKLTFRTTRFSDYVVAYETPENAFTDVGETDYYYDAALWANANGVTCGMTETEFRPEYVCTRAQMVTFLWRAVGCPAPKTSGEPFTDVKAGDYYHDAVLWAVENGITNGMDGVFNPNGKLTRSQAATFLYRLEGRKTAGKTTFDDMVEGAWYYDAALWAIEAGVTNGSDGKFAPDQECPRSQAVSFIYRTYVR